MSTSFSTAEERNYARKNLRIPEKDIETLYLHFAGVRRLSFPAPESKREF